MFNYTTERKEKAAQLLKDGMANRMGDERVAINANPKGGLPIGVGVTSNECSANHQPPLATNWLRICGHTCTCTCPPICLVVQRIRLTFF